MKQVSKLTLCIACALCAGLPAFMPGSETARAYVAQPAQRPNIVVLMTDDQTLRSMRAMPHTRELIGEAGATFTKAFVNHPRCCPSRTTFLTGQYSHNHGVLTNGPPLGGWDRLRGTSNWLPTWLQQAGYHTVHVGKFLNNYGRRDPYEVLPGWNEWYATVDPTTYRYYGYTVNENGTLHTYGRDQDPSWYSTDFVSRRSADIASRLAVSPQPFFLTVAFLAPHTGSPREPGDPLDLGTPAVAARDRGAFAGAPLPRPASFNEADISDKPPSVRRPRLTPGTIAEIQSLYRQRLESLIAVDEGVDRIVAALRDDGELERTLIVFTSDNGYLAGEHRLPNGKAQVYEPAIRVPLLIRGPGVPSAVRPSQLVTNADLAPTILDAAGATPGRPQDGRSLLPLARDPKLGRARSLLIEIARGTMIAPRQSGRGDGSTRSTPAGQPSSTTCGPTPKSWRASARFQVSPPCGPGWRTGSMPYGTAMGLDAARRTPDQERGSGLLSEGVTPALYPLWLGRAGGSVGDRFLSTIAARMRTKASSRSA